MTRIVDTSIRLLSQQPLVGTISTGGVLQVAEILDQAGFAALEVTRRRLLRGRGAARHRESVGADPRVKARCRDAAADGAARHVPGRLAAAAGRPRAPLHPLRRRVGDRHLPAARPAQRRRRPGLGRPRRCASRAGACTPAWPSTPTWPSGTRLVDKARRLARAGRRPGAGARPGRGARPGHLRPRDRPAARGRGRAGRAVLPGHRAGTRWRWRSRPRGPVPSRSRRPRYPVAVHAAPCRRRAALRGADRPRRRPRRRRRAGVGGVAPHRPARTSRCRRAPVPPRDHAARRLQPPAGRARRRPGRPAAHAGGARPAGRGARGVQAGCGRTAAAAAGAAGGRHPGRPGRRHVLSARRWDEVSPDMRDYLSGVYGRPAAGDRAGDGGRVAPSRRPPSIRRRTSSSCGPTGWPPARRSCCWWPSSATTPAGCWPRCAAAAIATRSSATGSSGASRSGSAS